jgi:hypothetical protein
VRKSLSIIISLKKCFEGFKKMVYAVKSTKEIGIHQIINHDDKAQNDCNLKTRKSF